MKEKQSFWRKLLNAVRRNIVAGLLFLLPIAITYLVLRFLFNTIDGVIYPAIQQILMYFAPRLARNLPRGTGIVILLILVYFIGLLGSNILGKWVGKFIQRLFLRVPIVGVIYSTAKQLIESFSGEGTTGFKRVVMIEYPRTNCWAIGFLTNLANDENGEQMALVYIPTTPTPNSGWLAIVPIEDV
ncbi:TPA: DUF502 domain-containing protein, partial [Candidatus Poribacteria bacterium]|nr:DUF502 domain-containing protein [Candidatus Poribacteria bacterium]